MNEPRLIGQNIELVMQKCAISDGQLASMLGYSDMDVHRIKEGVLLLSGRELEEIAKALNVKLESLLERREESEYRELLHCMGSYHNVENKDKILDYIDTYIEIEEARALIQ